MVLHIVLDVAGTSRFQVLGAFVSEKIYTLDCGSEAYATNWVSQMDLRNIYRYDNKNVYAIKIYIYLHRST